LFIVMKELVPWSGYYHLIPFLLETEQRLTGVIWDLHDLHNLPE
jgi:hypothetical protein